MDKDFYNMVNSDVIRDKEELEKTGRSPARERQIALNREFGTKYPGLPTTIEKKRITWKKIKELAYPPHWKNLWRVMITRYAAEEGTAPPRGWQRTYYDFDSDTVFCYPFGIAQLVMLGRLIWHLSYRFLRWSRNIAMYDEGDLRRARQAGFKEGRDFEFRAMREAADRHITDLRRGLRQEP